jgi:arginase family enzyme
MRNISRYILNFSAIRENELLELSIGAKMFDLSDIEGTTCYIDPDSEALLTKRISSIDTFGVHWIDTGNFHYLTKIFAGRIRRPFKLLLFDHHPDCQCPVFGSILSCGGWVRSLVESNPCLKGILMAGINDDAQPLVRDFGRDFPGISLDFIPESELRLTRPQYLRSRLDRLGGESLPFYISIDKDVLSEDFARTNWDQGSMGLDWLSEALKSVLSGGDGEVALLGLDICGGLGQAHSPRPEDERVNWRTDMALNDLVKDWY